MLSASGFRDGLGERDLLFDREQGKIRERLFVRPELAAYETALRRRIGRLASMEDARLVPVEGVDHDRATGRLCVLSTHLSGTRLFDTLRTARERELVPDLTIGLFLAAEILTAAHTFHALSGLPHGALTPNSVVITSANGVALTDYAYAEVLEGVGFSPRRLWQEFGIAYWLGEAFSFSADVRQVGLIAIALMLGRPLDARLPDDLEALVAEVEEAAVIRGGRLFGEPVIGWLTRALGAGSADGFTGADDAAEACVALLTERERADARPALQQFLQDLDAAAGEQQAAVEERVTRQPDIEQPVDRPVIEETVIEQPVVEPPVIETPPVAVPAPQVELPPPPAPARLPLSESRPVSWLRAVFRSEPKRRAPEPVEEPQAAAEATLLRFMQPAHEPGSPPAEAVAEPVHAGTAFDSMPADASSEPAPEHEADPIVPWTTSLVREPEIEEHEPGAPSTSVTRGREPEPIFTPLEELEGTFAAAPEPAQPEPEAEPVSSSEAEPVVECEPEPVFAPEPEPAVAPEPEPVFASEPEPVAEPEPEPVLASEPEPAVASEPQPWLARQPEPFTARVGEGWATSEPEEVVASAPEPSIVRGMRPPAAEEPAPPTEPLRASEPPPSLSGATASWPPPPTPDFDAVPVADQGITPFAAASERRSVPEFEERSSAASSFAPLPPIPTPAPPSHYGSAIEPVSAAPVPIARDVAPPPAFTTGPPVLSPAPTPRVESGIRLKGATSKAKAGMLDAEQERSGRPLFGRDEAATGRSGFAVSRKLAAAAVVLLVAGLAAAKVDWTSSPNAAPVPPGILVIETTPPGSEVFIDGKARGITPTTVEVVPGRHEVKLARKDASHAWAVDVASGARRVERLDWRALYRTGGIEVVSNNIGSRVLVDGKVRGEAPLVVTDLTPGRHTVVVQGPNGNVRRRVTVVAGETTKLDLSVYSGWVVVNAPIELQIVEEGKVVGMAGEGPLVLSAGMHTIDLVNQALGYRSTHIVDIAPGEEERLAVAPTGQLNANATPWAEVWLDGNRLGETPLANIKVPLGTVELIFKHPEHGERRVAVTVTASEPAQATVDFNK